MPDPITAMAGSAILGAGASIYGANKQADAASNAANQNADLQRYMYDQTRADQAPWRQAGEQALNQLLPLVNNYQRFGMSQFQRDPGYGFRLEEGLNALRAEKAALGKRISGDMLKGAMRYSQDYASGEYGNAFNRYLAERNAQLGPLQSLAGVGQSAVNYTGQAGQQYAANAGNALMQGQTDAAAARASGYMGAANALSSGVGNYYNYQQQQQFMNQLAQQRNPYYGVPFGNYPGGSGWVSGSDLG